MCGGSLGRGQGIHYDSTLPQCSYGKRPPLIDEAAAVILKHSFVPLKAHCAVEAKPPIQWNKGRASIHILRTTFGIDWSDRVKILYVGDDTTDEDAMAALKGMAVTFRVANSQTTKSNADHRLHDTSSVLTLLQWVKQHFTKRTNTGFSTTQYTQ